MTQDEYVFKNATLIAERQIRAGRKLQSKEVARVCVEIALVIKDLLIDWRRQPASE